jgi:hypothetical protein
MSADNKSSLVQIAQAVLDEPTQSIKVRLDSQSVQINVNLDENEDSVTVHQSPTAWVVQHITEPVATKAKQDEQLVKLEAVRVATVEAKDATILAKDATILAKDATLLMEAKVSTAAKQDAQTTELQAIKGHVDGVETTLSSVDGKLYSTLVSGNSSLHVTVDNPTPGLATLAEQQTQTAELTAIKGHVDQVEAKIDNVVSQLTALNAKSARLDAIHTSYLDYSATNVTDAAWVTLATIPANVEVREIAIFDSSGEVGEIGVVANVGDTPTTVRTLIFPGGNMPMPIVLTAGQVLKIRAKSIILNTGVCVINYYGVSTL